MPPRVAGMYYQAVIASVLLYGSESWVVSPTVLRELEGFHVEAARRLTGMRPRKVEGKWVYPHSADVLTAAQLQTIENYIQKRRHTVYNNIRDRKALKECEGAERRRGTPPRLFWSEQDMSVPATREYGAEGGDAHSPCRHPARAWPCRHGPLSQRHGRKRPCRWRFRSWRRDGAPCTFND